MPNLYSSYYADRATMAPETVQLFEAVDAIIDASDELDDPISILRTVWGAIGNKKMMQTFEIQHCMNALALATDRIEIAREKLSAKASEVIENSVEHRR